MYDLGRGAGVPIAKRRDPEFSTRAAAREFMQYYRKGARGGELAYRAQRPADQQGYINKINSYLADARRVLGQSGPNVDLGGSPPSPQTNQPNENGGSNNNIAASVAGAIATRQPGQSLFKSVTQGALQSVLAGALDNVGQPALSPRKGLVANPQGFPQGEGSDVVNAAKRWIGTPYSWGGGTPGGPSRGFAQGANTVGFDCSSLMQNAWAKMGVTLPRTTYGQIKVGQGIDTKNPGAWRPGDLMFPSTGHVQMYIGNGKVIEAPRTGGRVQIVPVRSKYIAVRRPA